MEFQLPDLAVLQAIFAAVVALSTVVYAVLTGRLVSETRRMRRAQTDAKVVVGVSTRDEWLNFVDLWVRNEGQGPATDVKFEVKDLSDGGSKKVLESVTNYGCLKHGASYMSAGQEFRTFLCSMVGDKSIMKTRVEVKASYTTAAGERQTDVHIIDFSIFEGTSQLGEPPLHTMAKKIESIAKDIGHLTTGFSKPRVITQDKADYDREMNERYGAATDAGEDPVVGSDESE